MTGAHHLVESSNHDLLFEPIHTVAIHWTIGAWSFFWQALLEQGALEEALDAARGEAFSKVGKWQVEPLKMAGGSLLGTLSGEPTTWFWHLQTR